MKREPCPAAQLVEGVTPSARCVLCRIESTERGQRSAGAGPIALVRETTSPASLHGFCLQDLTAFAADVAELGPLATDEQRRIAAGATITGNDGPGYVACPSWRAEKDNNRAAKLVDLPGARRSYGEQGARAA